MNNRIYSYKNTVQVQRFVAALFPSSSQDFCQAPGVVDSQDVDVIFTAEGLNERKVDLQRYVFNVIVIRSQYAQNHIIRVSGGQTKTESGF